MVTERERDPQCAEWVLEQKRIRIRDATIVWEDQLRKERPLVWADLEFAQDHSGRHHRLGLSAKRTLTCRRYSKLEVTAACTNTYDRKNIFHFDRVRYDRVTQLPIMPSLSASLQF